MTEATINRYFPHGLVTGAFTDAGRHLTLTQPLVYLDLDFGRDVMVPAGFQTDFNSVPRGLWNFFPPWEYPEAGVVHDWLYQHPGGYSRVEVDQTHRRILEIEGAGRFFRNAAYTGIRLGGGSIWQRYRDHQERDQEREGQK